MKNNQLQEQANRENKRHYEACDVHSRVTFVHFRSDLKYVSVVDFVGSHDLHIGSSTDNNQRNEHEQSECVHKIRPHIDGWIQCYCVGRIRQETQVNVNWNDNGQCTQQDVHLAHIIFGNVVLDETDDTLRFLIISVRKTISIELDYLSLKVLDLLRARVEVFTNLLGFDD